MEVSKFESGSKKRSLELNSGSKENVQQKRPKISIEKSGSVGSVTFRYCPKRRKEIASKHIIASKETFSLIEQEVILLRDLQYHPNIVEILNFYPYDKEDSHIIELEKADFDLKDYIKMIHSNENSRSKITNDTVKSLAKDLLNGLRYCHLRKIYHADLKPANILVFLSPGGKVIYKLADFSSAYSSTMASNPITGTTFVYSPPELLLDKRRYHNYMYLPDNKTDTFSLGLVLLEFIEGKIIIWNKDWSKNKKQLTRKSVIQEMCSLFGLPDEENDWKELMYMDNWKLWKQDLTRMFRKEREYVLRNERSISRRGKEFILDMLKYNPRKRKSIFECGRSDWIVLPESLL